MSYPDIDEVGDYEFSPNYGDGVYVTGFLTYNIVDYDFSMNIPSVDPLGNTVIGIAESAFRAYTGAYSMDPTLYVHLVEVTIPSTVTYIGPHAFSGCPLTNVHLPSSVVTVGDYAFADCSLTSMNIPANTKTIGEYAFANTSIGTLTIPSNVETLGDSAFRDCTELTAASVQTTKINKISDWLFSGCTSLRSVSLPSGINIIGRWAFYNCPLTSVTIPSSVTMIDDHAYSGTSITDILLPNSVQVMGEGVFDSCINLRNVTLSTGCGYINKYTFMNCTNLTSFVIPDWIGTILDMAFAGSGLESITIPAGLSADPFHSLSPFYSCINLTTVNLLGGLSYVSEYGTYHLIPPGFFDSCPALTNFTIPANVDLVMGGAFTDCTALTDITLPGNVVYLGDLAFYGASSMEAISFENAETFIEDNYSGLTIPDAATIYGLPDSTAKTYAETYNRTFAYITGEPLPQVAQPSWSDKVLTWQDVSNAERYQVKLYNASGEALDTQTVASGIQRYDFTDLIENYLPAGSYQATVQALPGE